MFVHDRLSADEARGLFTNRLDQEKQKESERLSKLAEATVAVTAGSCSAR
jgi:hypothetical protein